MVYRLYQIKEGDIYNDGAGTGSDLYIDGVKEGDYSFYLHYKDRTYGPFAQESILEEHFDFDRDDWLYLISKESDDFQSPLADLYLASTFRLETTHI